MLKKTLALVGLSISLSANTAIVDSGNITLDTATVLGWLNVTETSDLSCDQVSAASFGVRL